MSERPTPETDAAEIDALTLDIPGQQVTDKVVRSFVARQLEHERDEAREDVWAGVEAVRRVTGKCNSAREQLTLALAAIRELPYIGKDLGWTEWRKKHAAIIEIAQREKEKKDECHYDAV